MIRSRHQKGVFFDRDGVINQAIVRDGKAFSPRTKEEFRIDHQATDVLLRLKKKGFRIIVVTNQPDIARKKMTQADLNWMTEQVYRLPGIDEVVVCPHDDHHNCPCRKPKPGMLLGSAEKWSINMASSFIIGDSWKDMDAGKAAGCTRILLDRSYNQDARCDFRVEDLNEALKIIFLHG